MEEGYVEEFLHQIAGHTNETVKRFNHKYVLKPQNKPHLFKREVDFYTRTFQEPENSSSAIQFVPQFHGVIDIKDKGYIIKNGGLSQKGATSIPCIILDDLTSEYEKPCLIDIKMGKQTFEPTASEDKIAREIKKYPYQEEIGFRLTGLKVWEKVSESYNLYDKHFGRSLIPEQVIPGLALYFYDGEEFRLDVIQSLIIKLEEILVWMKQQIHYKFFCSSILVVYDASAIMYNNNATKPTIPIDKDERKSRCSDDTTTTQASEDTSTSLESNSRDGEDIQGASFEDNSLKSMSFNTTSSPCRVAMIDFAHAIPNEDTHPEVDEGYIHGLISLIEKLRHIEQLILLNLESCYSNTSPEMITDTATTVSGLLNGMASLTTKSHPKH